MPTINQLSPIEVSGGLNLAVYSPDQGDARRISITDLLAYFTQAFESPTVATTVYTPTTGFSIPVVSGASQWVLIQPASGLAAGTVVLPLNTSTSDGTEVLVTSTQAITALAIGLNGSSVAHGVPTTLAANGYFKLRFVSATNSWYRVG